MTSTRPSSTKTPAKAPTGIAGFDSITHGGLPHGRATLLAGGPGSGKTVLALQFLVHGARACSEPGIFVAFEESSPRIASNAGGFGWNLAELMPRKLYFLDAQPGPDLIQSGDFDLSGMLAALDAKARQMKARRIVFDALDVALALLPSLAAKRREMLRLHQWLLARRLTGIITAKAEVEDANTQSFGFMQFMLDCAVILNHGVVAGVSQRSVRVLKYRGSKFDEDEAPFQIGERGILVSVARMPGRKEAPGSDERVSSGVKRLDTMLHGGYFRGASVLVTGSAGTGKTTLCGAFTDASCRRGERTLFVSFDSDGSEVIRNLTSVGIALARHMKSGVLRMVSARSIAGSADSYMERIKSLVIEQRARCVVIDPMSTWSRQGTELSAHSVADHLIGWSKSEGITVLATRLVDDIFGAAEASAPLQISTLVDTWIHLNYLVKGGERNRGLSIIKSRGTAHSNQERELLISDHGVTLADAYTAGGEALMGTLRWEKESADIAAQVAAGIADGLERTRLAAEEAVLAVRLQALQQVIAAKREEQSSSSRVAKEREASLKRRRVQIRQLRNADAAPAGRK